MLTILTGNSDIATFITDRDLALMIAISTVLPNSKHQLCTWYIFKNIKNKLKGININKFIQTVRELMYNDLSESQTEQEIKELCLQKYQETTQKFAYKAFLYQNTHIYDDKDTGLKELHLVCSKFAFETFVKRQKDLVISGEYGVLKYNHNIYKIVQIDDKVDQVYVVISICISPNEIYQHWHAQYTPEIGCVSQLAVQIFEKLPECYHNDLLNLMQNALEYILENGKSIFETTSIDNATNYKDIKLLKAKKLSSIDTMVSKKAKKLSSNDTMMSGIKLNPLILHNAVLQPECLQKYWFYVLEYAQLASDTFNIPIAVFGVDSTSSFLFLLFNQKPGRHKKPIILNWYKYSYIVFVKLKPNRDIQVSSLNSQYIPACHHLGISEE
ncbi:19119_t:CDS:2 [Dentiscutata erythropus]|uniref:19119_t:CDS:1 n=1 Tax=Dentiscutata erythropus TaxID=1348616 RepID=A0A9N9HFQ1_9GLOM|nr:19119_t:CDS:2 [Dentiscutata erythropus]